MSLAEFDWVESASTALDEEPAVGVVKFGDGYEHRMGEGLNTTAQRWDVVFNDVDNAIADDILAYFRTANAEQAFAWTPLWHTAAIKVVCRRWRRVQASEWGKSNISARFEQVFEP